MKIERLSVFEDNAIIRADLVVVGGGPTGLAIASECARPGLKVIVLESGLEIEDEAHEALNAVEYTNELRPEAISLMRTQFHGRQTSLWSDERQPYGVRCRGLGGSTQAWAGKSAPFDPIDFTFRPWVSGSGWPIRHEDLVSYLQRAHELLNLCPNYPPEKFDSGGMQSFYWQFARSRFDRLDIMRFGREYAALDPENVDIVVDATVTQMHLDESLSRISGLEVSSVQGKRTKLEARQFVLAAGGIENARLLLASGDTANGGIGNKHDVVGRFLIDHVGARLGSVPSDHIARMARFFGFFGVRHVGRSHMFMHGLSLRPEIQEREELLNASIYFMPQRAPDDPFDALKRLLRRKSGNVRRDFISVVRGSKLLVSGLGLKMVASEAVPSSLREFIVNSAIWISPNLVAEEFESQGYPHRLIGLDIEAITEQAPCRDNRVTLGDGKDQFGIRLPRVEWRVGEAERRTLLRLAETTQSALDAANLPRPLMEDWVCAACADDVTAIDMAHTMGTTRMAEDEKSGVVDRDCRVFGLSNLYIAGGSVFPTGGHANPTLMILAVALRLADHLKLKLAQT